ncbi:hypothetical protein LA080_001063 [Diaporthe eres]|nr:hypothetical protein LA080_001063 [Diaporthe eres]
MQFTTAAVLALVAGVLALPPTANQDLEQSLAESLAPVSPGPCGELARKAVCCRKSIFSVIDVGCHRAKPDTHTGLDLAAECAAKKKMPRCCIMGILGNYLFCKPPLDVAKELGYYDPEEYHDVEVIITDPEWE